MYLRICPLRHPPGTQIRALAFLIMVNDLVVENYANILYKIPARF